MLTCTYFYPVKLGLEVLEEEYTVAVYLQDGRVAIFPDIMVGEESFSYENRMLLRRKDNCYELLDPESRYIAILIVEKFYSVPQRILYHCQLV